MYDQVLGEKFQKRPLQRLMWDFYFLASLSGTIAQEKMYVFVHRSVRFCSVKLWSESAVEDVRNLSFSLM